MSQTVKLTNGSEFEFGCILAGHRGWRISADLIDEVAEPQGFEVSAHDRRALILYRDGWRDSDGALNVSEHVWGMADEAEEFLNGLVPEDVNAAFLWDDGEFYFRPTNEEGEAQWG